MTVVVQILALQIQLLTMRGDARRARGKGWSRALSRPHPSPSLVCLDFRDREKCAVSVLALRRNTL